MIRRTRLSTPVGRRHPTHGSGLQGIFFAALVAAGCSGGTPEQGDADSRGGPAVMTPGEVVLDDASGRTVRLDGPARRIECVELILQSVRRAE